MPTKSKRHETIEIPLAELTVSKLNVRRHGGKDITSLAATIAKRGLIYPLLVRRIERSAFEVIAGKRRFLALQKLDKSGDVEGSLAPCIVLDADDDATAIELSLMENTERLPMDALDQCTAFMALVREGREEADIAHTFAVPVATVRKRLALAGLVPESHAAYRAGDIDDKVLHALTLGSKERQKAYIRLLRDPEAQPPPVWQLKAWMLGGQAIDASHARFDLKAYTAPITSDLFGGVSYLSDPEEFWRLQNVAIAREAETLKANGWKKVHILGPDQPFAGYQWEPATKAQGGHVVIKLNPDGSVQIEKGLISREEAKSRRRVRATEASGRNATTTSAVTNGAGTPIADGSATVGEMKVDADGHLPEMTAALRNYVDLVRHSAVCAKLLDKPKVALRVLAASMIAGARNIQIARDRRHALTPEIAASIARMTSETAQDSARSAVLGALGFPVDRGLFGTGGDVNGDAASILLKLMDMSDAQVLAILAIVATDSLAVGSKLVDALGETLAVDVREHWQPDMTLLALANRRPVIAAIATEVMGADAPRAHAQTLTGARAVIAETLKSSKLKWQPRWTQFPSGRYLGPVKPDAPDTARR